MLPGILLGWYPYPTPSYLIMWVDRRNLPRNLYRHPRIPDGTGTARVEYGNFGKISKDNPGTRNLGKRYSSKTFAI